MNPLPPQAYTKETMVKAYQWLQHQSDNIKEMATNPDILVSLYLKAKLQGEAALERPSIQNFKNELKNLAGMMGEFEVVETPSIQSMAQSSMPAQAPQAPAPSSYRAPEINYQQPSATFAPSSSPAAHAAPAAPVASAAAGKPKVPSELDTRSWLMIQEVKSQMNLSSDQEALRLLISVGHSKIKGLMNP